MGQLLLKVDAEQQALKRQDSWPSESCESDIPGDILATCLAAGCRHENRNTAAL
jgi:hypothetical protein